MSAKSKLIEKQRTDHSGFHILKICEGKISWNQASFSGIVDKLFYIF